MPRMHVLFRYDTIEQQLEQVAVQTMHLLYTIFRMNGRSRYILFYVSNFVHEVAYEFKSNLFI